MRALLRRIIATLVGIAGFGWAIGVGAQVPTIPIDRATTVVQELVATQQFQQRVDEYVFLHRVLEGPLPLPRPTTNPEEIRMARRALGERMQAARAGAKQGDIISPEVALMFKRRIAACLTPGEWQAILTELATDEEGVPIPVVPLRVNMPWPEQVPFGFVPPQMLSTLPPLPPELQYRIIGSSLVLWDDHADLIVDFLPGVFTSTT
jgi:hypothetical protein